MSGPSSQPVAGWRKSVLAAAAAVVIAAPGVVGFVTAPTPLTQSSTTTVSRVPSALVSEDNRASIAAAAQSESAAMAHGASRRVFAKPQSGGSFTINPTNRPGMRRDPLPGK